MKHLEQNLNNNSNEYFSLKSEYEQLQHERIKGSIVRSRIKWSIEGEKPTRYFCGLEKSNTISKTVKKIIKDDGSEITKQKIFWMKLKYFTSLCTSQQLLIFLLMTLTTLFLI